LFLLVFCIYFTIILPVINLPAVAIVTMHIDKQECDEAEPDSKTQN